MSSKQMLELAERIAPIAQELDLIFKAVASATGVHRPPDTTITDLEAITDRMLLFAPQIGKSARDLIQQSYRVAGFTAWDFPASASDAIGLVTAHMELVRESTPPAE